MNQVYSIFQDFFGEELTDLQDNTILVRFPKVTITNEVNQSVDITELYVRLDISSEGRYIPYSLNMIRSEFTSRQWRSGYSHSHLPVIHNNHNHWASPCLGIGPIRGTLHYLSQNYNEDKWKLFCYELTKYVKTESLEGGPYIKLSSIGGERNQLYHYISSNILRDKDYDWLYDFINYIIEKKPFEFCVNNGCYSFAASIDTIVVTLSNLLIKWFNSLSSTKQRFINPNNFLIKGVMKGSQLYMVTNSSGGIIRNTETTLFTFKGKPIIQKIIRDTEDNNYLSILPQDIASLIIDILLLNLNYGIIKQNTAFISKGRKFFI